MLQRTVHFCDDKTFQSNLFHVTTLVRCITSNLEFPTLLLQMFMFDPLPVLICSLPLPLACSTYFAHPRCGFVCITSQSSLSPPLPPNGCLFGVQTDRLTAYRLLGICHQQKCICFCLLAAPASTAATCACLLPERWRYLSLLSFFSLSLSYVEVSVTLTTCRNRAGGDRHTRR